MCIRDSLWAERSYQAMPRLSHFAVRGPLPMLSIIVPARNEAHNLVHLLPSLQKLRYPGPMEVIVVDDNSTDGTSFVARAYGAKALCLNHLPDGWKGKPNACHRGARAAQGQWLLFTDADTIHQPDSAAQAVGHAIRNRLDGLSLFLRQDCSGWIDRLALTAAYAGLFLSLIHILPMWQYSRSPPSSSRTTSVALVCVLSPITP